MDDRAVLSDDPISRLTALERDALGIPSWEPDIFRTPLGFAMWEDELDGDSRPALPTTRPGLVSQSSVTFTGTGSVQMALAYLRHDGTYLVVARETHDDGELLFAADADDIRVATVLLGSILMKWSTMDWSVSTAGATAEPLAGGLLAEPAPDTRVVIDLAAYRRNRTRVYLV